MNKEQRARYARHIQLDSIGEQGQERLLASRALVIGMGGLGSPAAMYLATSGVGHLVLSDYDQVELSNLQRQIAHTSADIGRLKTDSARDTLLRLNPTIEVTARGWALEDEELTAEVAAADVVLDCTDNFETRFMLNAACLRAGRPLVSAAAVRMDGQVSVFHPGRGDSPCYRCLYDDAGADGEPCSRVGVFAPLLGIVGSVQAAEALKVLLQAGRTLQGRLLFIDALDMEWRMVRLKRDPACPLCGGQAQTAAASAADASR